MVTMGDSEARTLFILSTKEELHAQHIWLEEERAQLTSRCNRIQRETVSNIMPHTLKDKLIDDENVVELDAKLAETMITGPLCKGIFKDETHDKWPMSPLAWYKS